MISKNSNHDEIDFLKSYDPTLYDKLSLTTDILVFGISNSINPNYRKLPEKKFSILLVKRKTHPFKDKWCLPGGFLQIDEELTNAPKRVLAKETNLHDVYLEQLYTFGAVNRDPRLRVVNVAYMALIDKDQLKDELLADTAWFNVNQIQKGNEIEIILKNEINEICFKLIKTNDDINDPLSYQIVENELLAFDNPLVIFFGLLRIRNKINYTDIVFNMMPKYFTLKELQNVYEVILGRKLLDPAFRRIIKDKVVQTEFVRSGGGHRPSLLYRYKDTT